ncbi:MAG: Smr/MutS family protein [Rhodobacteraceae bacterium]|nr:Smr/MutS family protein [Paracoccaceae bacterium]
MKRPRLSENDLRLWRRVTDQVEPISVHAPLSPDNAKPAGPKKASISPIALPPNFRIGDKVQPKPSCHDLKPGIFDFDRGQPVAMDRKAFGKMKRGQLKPKGRIDLHGLTLAEAYPALSQFIFVSHATRKRLVLVITGKGREDRGTGPIPTPCGVLRYQVPQWLSVPPLARLVLQISEAHVSHGGSGAYYVYLRKLR